VHALGCFSSIPNLPALAGSGSVGGLKMKKWKFRNDMLSYQINSVSKRTFQDAEDRLNFLEENCLNVLEELKKLKKCYNGDEDAIMKPISF
jgi:hypothetical protein